MADVNSNIFINIDTVQAMSALRGLDKQLSAFNRSMVVGTRAAQVAQADFTRSLLHNVNATGAFTGSMAKMSTSVDQFSRRLDAGKLSLREYYRYSMASTRTFGRFFGKEFETVSSLVQKRVKTLQSQYVGLGRDAQGALNAMRMTPKKLNYDDQLTRMQMTIQRQQIFNKLLNDGSTRLLNFGKNTQWAGRQLMVGFTIPLAMFAASAIKSFKEIETQAIRFKKVYGELFTTQGETDAALKQMQKIADEYTKYGLKVSDTIKTAADAAASGAAGTDLEQMVKQANKLAVLGGVAQDKSLETIIALKNAFGITADELGKTIDFLNAVENQTVLTLDDLTEAIPRVAPVIKQLGGDVKDLSIFLTAMKEGGVSAAQGANALKSGLASLINPSTAAVKATSALGINLKAIVESNAGDLKATVMEFANSLNTLNDLQRGQIIEKIFGKYQFARLSAMFNNITKEGTQANRVMRLTVASAEELAILSQREMKTQESSAMNKMQSQIEKLKAAIAPIGELFAKTLTPVIEFFVKLFNKFNEMPDGIKRIVTLIVAGVAGIGPVVLMTVGLVANGIANLMKMFNLVRQGYQRLAYGSKDAALGTRYMTQEELENTAVTNALTTSHQNLSAAYVLESSSLKALTAVYQQANAAMSVFAKNNPGMFMPGAPRGGGRPPLRYNKGVDYVPGSGNTDTVPAMLTPGEAVVSKPMVKKHRGLISAIVNDKVPGHRFGINSVLRMVAPPAESLTFGAAARVGGSAGVAATAASRFPFTFRTRADGMVDATIGRETITIKPADIAKVRERFETMASQPAYKNPTVLAAKIADLEKKIVRYRTAGKKLDVGTSSGKGLFSSVLPWSDRGAGSGKVAPSAVTQRLQKVLTDPVKGRDLRKLLNEYSAEIRAVETELVSTGVISRAEALRILKAESFDFASTRVSSGKGGLAASHLQDLPGVQRGPSDWLSEKIARDHVVMNSAMNYIRKENGGRHVTSAIEAQRAIEILNAKEARNRANPIGKNPWTTTDKIARHILQRRIKTNFYDNPEMKFMDSDYMGPGVYALNRGGVVPKYMAGVAAVPKKPLFLGMPLGTKAVAEKRTQQTIMDEISLAASQSRFAGMKPTSYGEQISASIGRSFPVPGIGGTYRKPNGDLVFVKPMVDEVSALAEVRATKIAREAHGLKSPKQSIKTMIDPTDPLGKRKIIVLESPIEEQFANMSGKFTKNQYIKQLVASALRGDKDLQKSNLSGNVLADVGTAGVFEKASGVRVYADNMPSMADQARINLLGVKGGAKRFFAESTLDVARKMSPEEYQAAMLKEIELTIPRLKKSIKGMKLDPKEQEIYDKMVTRLEEGKGVNWAEFHAVHTSVVPEAGKKLSAKQILEQQQKRQLRERQAGHANTTPYRYNKGVFSVPGTGNQDTVPAMLTPGEAVIPKSMAKKYAPLVDGIITDSIPGHKTGKKTGVPKPPRPTGPGAPRTGVPRPLPGQDFGGPSVVRPNWRGRVQRAQRVIQPMATKAAEKSAAALAASLKAAGKGAVALGKATATGAEKVSALSRSTRSLNADFAPDKTRGFRGFMTGFGKVPDMIRDPETGQDRKATQAERKNMRQDLRMQKSSRMMGVGMAAMMVPMIAGAAAANNPESGFGKFAKDNMGAIMGLSMLPMLLPLLNSPIKMLVAGIVALIAVYKVQSAQIKKSIQDGIAQGRATGNTIAALEEFGKITGNVSATQIQDAKRKNSARQLVPVDQTFGRSFAGSEFGKTFIADFKKSATVAGVDAANILGTKLAGAVSQGVISTDQAESIIVNIARENNDQRLELDARAVLRQVVGPNGQDLKTKPLEVQTRLLLNNKEIQDQVQTAFANVVEAEMGGSKLGRLIGLGTGINKSEAKQLAITGAAGLPVAAYGGIKAAGATTKFLSGTGMLAEGGTSAKVAADLKKTAEVFKTGSKALTALKTARTALTVGAAASAGTGIGIPAAVGLAASTAILFGIEYGVRKFQQGQEKKKVGAVSGVVAGSSIQNLQAVQQSLDSITQTEEIQIQKLKTEKDIAKTAEQRLAIEKKMLDVRNTADKDRTEIAKVTGQILNSQADFYKSITSDDAQLKVKESYDIAYQDFAKNAVGAQKQSYISVDAMLNRDAGLLKTENLRGAVDYTAVNSARMGLDSTRKQIAELEAKIAAGGNNSTISKAEKDLKKAKRFESLYAANLAEAQKGKLTNVSEEQSAIFRMQVQSLIVGGVLSVESAETLINTMNANGKDYTQALKLRLDVQGGPEVERLGVAMSYLKDNDKKRVEIATAGMNGKEINEFNNGIEELIKLPPDVGIDINLEVNGEQDINAIKTLGKEITAIKDQFPDGKVTRSTLELYQKTIGGEGKNATLDFGIKNFEMIEKYAPDVRLQAMVSLKAIEMSDSFKKDLDLAVENEFRKLNPTINPTLDPTGYAAAFNAWKLSEEGKAFALKVKPEMLQADLDLLFAEYTKQEAKRRAAEAAAKEKANNSWVDDILLKLKMLKQSTIDARKGLAELEKYFGSKAGKSANPYLDKEGKGVLAQIERAAKNNKTAKGKKAPIELSPDFMAIIKDMDVDTLASFTKRYLNTDKAGNITGLKDTFKVMNEGIKTLGIAQFLRKQEELNIELDNQNQLFNKLVDPTGKYKWSVEQATWAMEDAALAGALMRRDQLSPEELARVNAQYAKRVKLLAAAKKTDTTENISGIGNQSKTITLLTKAGVNFTDALDISKVSEYADEIALAYTAADATGKMTAERAEEIRNKFKGYISDAKALRDAMFNLEQQSETRSDKITDQFAADQARITVAGMAAFRTANKMSVEQFNVITKEKEALQAQFQDQVTKYSDGLASIEKLETATNEKYDAKVKLIDEQVNALNKVVSVNEDIAAQQQGQLTIADALTQGDISAAAKAAADYSAQQASIAGRSATDALDEQKSALEIARQAEIDKLTTSINGKLYTKKQLNDEITRIQEQQIKPLEKEIKDRNDLVAAFELGIEKQLKSLEIQGMTSEEWGAIKDAVGLLNDAYDAQVIDINSIATSVGGVSGAWNAVTTAVNAASLAVGKYPGFKQESDVKTYATTKKKDKDGNMVDVYTEGPKAGYTTSGALYIDPGTGGGGDTNKKGTFAEGLAKNDWVRSMSLSSQQSILKSMGYYANGGFVAKGTDTVPAMLTPGEFVVKKNVAEQYGELLQSLNSGTYKNLESPTYSNMNNSSVNVGSGSSKSSAGNSSKVYNYNVGISVNNTNASADDIAKAVMSEIKYIDSQRLRGQR